MLIQTKSGRRQRVNDKVGRVLIQRGLATEVQDGAAPAPRAGYQTRMMQAGGPADLPPAPALDAPADADAPSEAGADETPPQTEAADAVAEAVTDAEAATEAPAPAQDAPYGLKADGTPRKRPAPTPAKKKTR